MPKRLIMPLLGLVFFLASCRANSTPPVAPTSPASPLAGSPTATLPASAVDTAGTETGLASMRGCTAASPEPTAGPTEQSIFPPVGQGDWTKGPETASVTIIEYSDFQ